MSPPESETFRNFLVFVDLHKRQNVDIDLVEYVYAIIYMY